MKTAEEFIREINDSKELQDEIRDLKEAEGLEEFLKRHGCEAELEEFLKCLGSQEEGEIDDDDAENAAGGFVGGYRICYIDKTKTNPKTGSFEAPVWILRLRMKGVSVAGAVFGRFV